MRTGVLLVTFFLVASTAQASVWRIRPDGSGDATTIQAGINAAAVGDTVLVEPGTYYEAIRFHGKGILVASEYIHTGHPGSIAKTVIDGSQENYSPVCFRDGEERSSVICGFTIAQGRGTLQGWNFGGGIFCYLASPTIRNMVIKDCSPGTWASAYGGGIAVVYGGSPLIEFVSIERCSAGAGGGIHLEALAASDSVFVRDSVITGNTASVAGGAVNLWGSRIILERVLMHSNTAYTAIDVWGGGEVSLLASTMADHPAHGIRLVQSRLTSVNSILWGSAGREIMFGNSPTPSTVAVVAYSDAEGGAEDVLVGNNGTLFWLDGNLDVDPRFVNGHLGNYRLESDSDCIDAGTPYFVWEGNVFVNLEPADYHGEFPDLGAFEFAKLTDVDLPHGLVTTLCVAPNPFNPSTTIRYEFAKHGPLSLQIFDVAGRRVRCLLTGWSHEPGSHEVRWDGRDESGAALPSGTYLLRLEAGGEVRTSRVALIR